MGIDGTAMARKTNSGNFDGDDYRKGALERLDDAFILLRAGQFSGSASDAGRAVEGMLRAIIWKRDADVRSGRKSLDTGHDLRELLTHVRNLGLLSPAEPEDDLEEQVMHVARLWFNNMRFASSKFVESRWLRLGEVRKSRTLKQAAELFCVACARVVKRCEILCQR
jgi:hypothetical protein